MGKHRRLSNPNVKDNRWREPGLVCQNHAEIIRRDVLTDIQRVVRMKRA
jgi:hypothetical protein